jgi:hypothetical protein
MRSRALLIVAAVALLGIGVVWQDVRDIQQGQLRLGRDLPPVAEPARARTLDARPWRAPAYVCVGCDLDLASLDPLSAPRILPPTICGRYAVAGLWRLDPRYHSLQNNVTEPLTISGQVLLAHRHWGVLHVEPGVGPVEIAAEIRVDGPAALTVPPVASTEWYVGRHALLCVDSDIASDGSQDYTAPTGWHLTFADGTGVVRVDGELDVSAGASITLESDPPFYPITLLEAATGIVGTVAAASLPPGWFLVQDSHFVRADFAP